MAEKESSVDFFYLYELYQENIVDLPVIVVWWIVVEPTIQVGWNCH